MERIRSIWSRGILLAAVGLVTSILASGQRLPTEIKIVHPFDVSCQDAELGWGFELSGMVNYVARPKIIQSSWLEQTLSIGISVVAECCPPDFLGYSIQKDTIVLYYGFKQNIPTVRNPTDQIQVCLCGHSGCCYEFEYQIPNLRKNINYLIATSNVLDLNLNFKKSPNPINYLRSEHKSIFYQHCDFPELCLNQYMEMSLKVYKELRPLYTDLMTEIERDSNAKGELLMKIRNLWTEFFSLEGAINDNFVKLKLEQKKYLEATAKHRSDLEAEMVELRKVLIEVDKHLYKGMFIEKAERKQP